MSKDTFYFSHDYNTRTDEKIKKLLKKHGMTGYGIFWSIVEDLYNNANAMQTDYDGIAFDLRTEEKIIQSIINDFGLFIVEDDSFRSLSIERRLDERNKKSESARQSANKRWDKNANANKTECERNANALINDAIYKEKDIKDIQDIKRRIRKKTPGPNPVSDLMNRDPGREEIQIQEENPEIQEPGQSRVRACEREPMLEAEYNLADLMGGNPGPESELQEQGWDHSTEEESDRKVISLSAEPKVTVNPEPCLEPEPTESENINGEPELTQDPEEIKFPKRITIDDDW